MGFKTKWNRFWTLRNTEGGFTLVELIVVIAILAILAGVAVPAYTGYIKRAREAGDQLLIAAVNEAFAGACLEAGIQVNEVADARISVVSQRVFGVSSVYDTTEEELTVIANTFTQLFEGNFDTAFVTENVKSLKWVVSENSFKMDHEEGAPALVMLSNGPTYISAANMDAIANSFIGTLNSETLGDLMEDIQDGATVTLLGVVDETVSDIGDQIAAKAGGGIAGTIAKKTFEATYKGMKKVLDEEQLGAWISLQSAGLEENEEVFGDRYDDIKSALESGTKEEKEAAMNEYRNAMLLYTANSLYDEDPTTIHTAVKDNYNNTNDLISTGGNGAKVVSAAIRETVYQGYLNTEAGKQAYANASGTDAEKKAALTASDDFTKYLESDQCANDIAGLVATMDTIQQNKELIGTSTLVQEGMSNEDANKLFEAITG